MAFSSLPPIFASSASDARDSDKDTGREVLLDFDPAGSQATKVDVQAAPSFKGTFNIRNGMPPVTVCRQPTLSPSSLVLSLEVLPSEYPLRQQTEIEVDGPLRRTAAGGQCALARDGNGRRWSFQAFLPAGPPPRPRQGHTLPTNRRHPPHRFRSALQPLAQESLPGPVPAEDHQAGEDSKR